MWLELKALEDKRRATKQLKSKKKHFKEQELKEFNFYESHIDHDDEEGIFYRIENNARFVHQEMVDNPRVDSEMYAISGLEGIKAPGATSETASFGFYQRHLSSTMLNAPFPMKDTIYTQDS